MEKIDRYLLSAVAAAFIILFVFWSIGYFANALYGYHFEINSAWQGFTTLSGAGMLSMVKYLADSWKNSAPGVNPYKDRGGDVYNEDFHQSGACPERQPGPRSLQRENGSA